MRPLVRFTRTVLPSVVVLWVAALDIAHAGPRDSCTVQPQSSSGFDSFHSHRPEERGTSLLHRDLEFHLDASYSGELTPVLRTTLDRLARTLNEYVGFSPIAQDANGYQATYNYFRRAGADWNPTDPWDTTSVRLGRSEATNLKPEDRAHADTYIFSPSRGITDDGMQPSGFFTVTEDVTSWRASGDLRHENSMMFKGPPDAQILDPAGTGWTRPREPYQTLFYHELQHSLPPQAGQGEGLFTELWSAAAEAVAGQYDYPRFDLPYTFNMLRNYQARTGFMAYLAYQFLNSDANRTLAGMRDDLLFKWNRSRDKVTAPNSKWFWLEGLGQVLSDDSCSTCASKAYLQQTGGPLNAPERVSRVHHNWRVAMFADNPSIAEGQYGYPAWSGFSPSGTIGAWRDIDVAGSNALVMPSIVTVGSNEKDHVRVFEGTRTVQGLTAPMRLSEMGAQYWVLRAGADVQDADRKLVVRVIPRGWSKHPGFTCCENFFIGGRLQASAIVYSQADTSSAEDTFLWRKPQWISSVTPVSLTDVDTLGAELEVAIPYFGATAKAVVLVITYGDGLLDTWRNRTNLGDNLIPYRIELELRPLAGVDGPATRVTAGAGVLEGGLVWSTVGDTLAFHMRDPAQSARTQIYKRSMGAGATPVPMRPQSSLDQYFPDWSPRGDLVVFEAKDPGNSSQSDLWTTHPTGAGPLVRITQHAGLETHASFQPDGQGLAYLRKPTSVADWELRWVGKDGTGDRLVTSMGSTFTSPHTPRWTRDGTRILLSLESLGSKVASISASGGAWVQMSTSPTQVKHFALHPGVGRLLTSLRTTLANVIGAPGNCFSTACHPDFVVGQVAFADTLVLPTIVSVNKNARAASVEDLRYSPSGAEIGHTGQASDGTSRVYRAQLTTSLPPGFANLGDRAATAGVGYSFSWTTSNSEGGPLTHEAHGLPYGATMPTSTSFEWASPVAGTYYMVFRVINSKGLATAKVVKLTVIEASCEPLCDGPPVDGGLGSQRAPVSSASRESNEPTLDRRNSFLDGSGFDEWARDVAGVTLGAQDQNGVSTIHLTPGAGASVVLDRVRLRIHDSEGSTRVWAGETGITTGLDETAGSVSDATGRDLVSAIAQVDGHVMEAGEAIEATWPSSPVMRGVLIDCARRAAGGSAGLLVQVPDGDGWRTVGRLQPRWNRDAIALAGVASERVRLVAGEGAVVYGVRRLLWEVGGAIAPMQVVEPLGEGPGGRDFTLAVEDGLGVTSDAEHPLELRFDLPAVPEGATRTAFLELTAKRIRSEAASPVEQVEPGEQRPEHEAAFAIISVRPNPVIGHATMAISLPSRMHVRAIVHDLQGARVRSLADEPKAAGLHALVWDGLDDRGARVRAGTYFIQLTSAEGTVSRRFVYLK